MSAAAAGGLHTTILIGARMEEGSHVVPTPQNQDTRSMADDDWKFPFISAFLMTFSTVLGGALLADLFVGRFVRHDPELQDEPFLMITLVVLASIIVGLGYLPVCCWRRRSY